MQWRALSESSFVLVFAAEEEVIAGLTEFATSQDMQFGSFTAVGSFSHGTLAWWDAVTKTIFTADFAEQVEVASFSGNLTWSDSSTSDGTPAPRVHAHAVLANGTIVKAGHVKAAYAYPELELVLTTFATRITRRFDSATNLWLLDLL